jgi:hypothetical protein
MQKFHLNEEVSFQDMCGGAYHGMAGYPKSSGAVGRPIRIGLSGSGLIPAAKTRQAALNSLNRYQSYVSLVMLRIPFVLCLPS